MNVLCAALRSWKMLLQSYPISGELDLAEELIL